MLAAVDCTLRDSRRLPIWRISSVSGRVKLRTSSHFNSQLTQQQDFLFNRFLNWGSEGEINASQIERRSIERLSMFYANHHFALKYWVSLIGWQFGFQTFAARVEPFECWSAFGDSVEPSRSLLSLGVCWTHSADSLLKCCTGQSDWWQVRRAQLWLSSHSWKFIEISLHFVVDHTISQSFSNLLTSPVCKRTSSMINLLWGEISKKAEIRANTSNGFKKFEKLF